MTTKGKFSKVEKKVVFNDKEFQKIIIASDRVFYEENKCSLKHTHHALCGHADENIMLLNIKKLHANFIDVAITSILNTEKVSVDIIKYCS